MSSKRSRMMISMAENTASRTERPKSREVTESGGDLSSSKEKDDQTTFRATTAKDASHLMDGVPLSKPKEQKKYRQQRQETNFSSSVNSNDDDDDEVILPWLGFGTYKQQQAASATLQALETGYRGIDTAFIYGGEKTEALVGDAIGTALERRIIQSRSELFITTKHWRKYHGYEASLECLRTSLRRLKVDYVDLWLMHWPGPAWKTMNRRKDLVERDAWHYSAIPPADMTRVRAETWRAMEDAYRKGLCRAIGVSNFSVRHLQTLKETATLWPPAVNQVEMHPLHPQEALREYCQSEGIVVQAYASLGGQDTGKKRWKELLGTPTNSGVSYNGEGTPKKKVKEGKYDLLHADAVIKLAKQVDATPGQVLLRWGLLHNCALIPKTTSLDRLVENAAVLHVDMSMEQADTLQDDLSALVLENNPDLGDDRDGMERISRLCWRNDPLRLLDFD